jgi:hypothetical protein
VEARNAVVGLEVEEARQMERILNLVQVFRWNIDRDLISEETQSSLADQMRFWEQEEREKISLEHGRRSGSSHVEV